MSFNFGDVSKPLDMATKAGGYARLPFEGLLQVKLQEFEVIRKEGKTGYVKMILEAAEPDTSGVIFTNVMLEGNAAFQFAQFLVSCGHMTQAEVNAAIAAKSSIDETAVCTKLVASGRAFAIEIANGADSKGTTISTHKSFVAPERFADATAKGIARRPVAATPTVASAPTVAAAGNALAGVI